MANVVKSLSSFRGHFPAWNEPHSLSNPPISMLGGCLPIFPALPLPSCCLWPGCGQGDAPAATHIRPQRPLPKTLLGFLCLSGCSFLHFSQPGLFGPGLRSEPVLEPVLWGCSCSVACHQLGVLLNGSGLQSACNAFKNKEQHMHSNQTYIFPVLQLFICPCSEGFSDVAPRLTQPFCPHCHPHHTLSLNKCIFTARSHP